VHSGGSWRVLAEGGLLTRKTAANRRSSQHFLIVRRRAPSILVKLDTFGILMIPALSVAIDRGASDLLTGSTEGRSRGRRVRGREEATWIDRTSPTANGPSLELR
jgi:hypothetical protein